MVFAFSIERFGPEWGYAFEAKRISLIVFSAGTGHHHPTTALSYKLFQKKIAGFDPAEIFYRIPVSPVNGIPRKMQQVCRTDTQEQVHHHSTIKKVRLMPVHIADTTPWFVG